MPPKSHPVTVESLYAVSTKISESDSPAEADYKTILGAGKGDKDLRTLAAQLIPQHAEKFPKQVKAAVTQQIALTSDEDPMIRLTALKNIPKLISFDTAAVLGVLIKCLDDDDSRIVQTVSPILSRSVTDNYKTVIDSLKSQTPEVQCKLIEIIKDNVTFTEETKEELIKVLESALTSNVLEGLQLYGKNKALIDDETKNPLMEKLVARVENSLDSNFEAVTSEILLPMLKYTRLLGDDVTKKLFIIIADKVMPKAESLSENVKIKIIQRVSECNKLIEGPNMITNLYEKVFLALPKETSEINFSVAEATLFAFLKLAKNDYKTASRLAGTVFVFTGQPGEADDVEDETRRKEFTSRLEYIESQSQPFIDHCKNLIAAAKANTTYSQDEKAEKIRSASTAIRTGGNVAQLCRLLLSGKLLNGRLPEKASWKKNPLKNRGKKGPKDNSKGRKFNKGGNRNDKRNDNRNRRQNFRRRNE